MYRMPTRRGFLAAASVTPLLSTHAAVEQGGSLTDIAGIRVGHFTCKDRPTGCTVVLFDKPVSAGVDVRGAAPGTRETDLLNPINSVQQIHALLLAGGSAYGLDAASGVMRFLEENGQGFRMGQFVVPIVPAAVLFDLQIGTGRPRPDAKAGYEACHAASTKLVTGNVGAGAGATVGKLFGSEFAMKTGLGTAACTVGDTDLQVAALVAVNAVGDVLDHRTGRLIAGSRDASGRKLRNSMAEILRGATIQAQAGAHTTLGVIATNAKLSKTEAAKFASMAHDGLARTINPIHTMADGDTIFGVSTGNATTRADLTSLGALGAEVMAQAVLNSILTAQSIPGYPAARDLQL